MLILSILRTFYNVVVKRCSPQSECNKATVLIFLLARGRLKEQKVFVFQAQVETLMWQTTFRYLDFNHTFQKQAIDMLTPSLPC